MSEAVAFPLYPEPDKTLRNWAPKMKELSDLLVQAAAWTASGNLVLKSIEVDFGASPKYSGSFDIAELSELTPGKGVLIMQAPGPYAGKGDAADEAEMDQVQVTGSVISADTIRCYWVCQPKSGPVAGYIKFYYQVSN